MCCTVPQIVFLLQLAGVATAVKFSVLVGNATVLRGGSVTLPCWLSPTTDAEGMEVRWYLKEYQTPVLLYHNGKLQNATQMEQYQNRTTLVPREPSSSLKQGDVSIRIEDVKLTDVGKFTCYVSSSEHYDSDHVFLKVEEIGASPILSLSKFNDGRINVSCMSTGWQPGPLLQWSLGPQQVLKPGGLRQSRGTGGLVTVQSWVVRPSSESGWISCSVFLPNRKEHLKEARVDVNIELLGVSSWMVAFIILVTLLLAAICALLLYLKKKKGFPMGTAEESNVALIREDVPHGAAEELNALLREEVDFIWCEAPELVYSEDMKSLAVDISVNKDAAPACMAVGKNGKMMRDKHDCDPTDYDLCVLVNPGFTSGQHYWEVGLKRDGTPVKNSWWVGVATDSAVQSMREQKSMPTSGLWCLYSDNKHGVHTKSGSSHYISMASRPEVLGIFLDYDNGRLSFYDTKLKRHLVTIKSNFRETVYPLFNPSKGDKAVLDILSLPVATPLPVAAPEVNSTAATATET
ncbi:butyrophilin subfamily 3 member A3 [Sardina pilchardus]|uniref:butyrophilin subfamily 3 member A3 n=1 Tax=Sardina pilchardus TaxID=27697 RepID=UPI002E133CBB